MCPIAALSSGDKEDGQEDIGMATLTCLERASKLHVMLATLPTHQNYWGFLFLIQREDLPCSLLLLDLSAWHIIAKSKASKQPRLAGLVGKDSGRRMKQKQKETQQGSPQVTYPLLSRLAPSGKTQRCGER